MLETILILLSTYFAGYAFMQFEPIQDKLLVINSQLLKPLKCLKCFYFWASLTYIGITTYNTGYDIRIITIWLFSVYVVLKLNK
jgi:hypothetical protein